MLLSVFENNYFLLALGWGIINSLWQAGILWLVYKLIEYSSKNISALFRYHLGLLLLFTSFLWFTVTSYLGYASVSAPGNNYQGYITFQWQVFSQQYCGAFQIISCAYMLVLSFNLVKFIRRFNGLRLLINSPLQKAPVDTRIFVNKIAAHLGIKRKVKVWISTNVDVPCITGYFKPVILLPFTIINHLTTEQAEAVIIHELAHIKRNDYLVNLVQSFVELILFFNPFAILLGKAVRKERENCCDDWVLNYQYSKYGYAKALMILEEQRQLPVKLTLAATSGKKQLLGRVKRLFVVNPQTDINYFQRVKLAGICLTFALFIGIILPGVQLRKSPVEPLLLSTVPVAGMLNAAQTGKTSNPEEIKFKEIINDKPVQTITAAIQKKKTKYVSKKHITKEIEFADALINEELLQKNTAVQNISTLVAEKLSIPALEYLVKVEEENSGSKEKTSYLLEYKIADGKSEIKPLVILNKSNNVKITIPKQVIKTAVSSKTKAAKRLRITS